MANKKVFPDKKAEKPTTQKKIVRIGNATIIFNGTKLDEDIKKMEQMVKEGKTHIAPVGYVTT